MIQPGLFDGAPREPFPSDRLTSQYLRVLGVMTFCSEVTLAELSRMAICSEASASARLREMRKKGWTVKRTLIGRGLYSYRAEPPACEDREQ